MGWWNKDPNHFGISVSHADPNQRVSKLLSRFEGLPQKLTVFENNEGSRA